MLWEHSGSICYVKIFIILMNDCRRIGMLKGTQLFHIYIVRELLVTTKNTNNTASTLHLSLGSPGRCHGYANRSKWPVFTHFKIIIRTTF